MKNTVAILGTAPTLAITPWDLPDVDYWACAPVITHKPAQGRKIDVIFEMHQIEYWGKPEITQRLNEYSDKNPHIKIYMQDKYQSIKNSEKYPLAEVQAFINHPKLRSYFTSTIAYMIALAIVRGYKKIELYGVHMASQEEEYSIQRSCVEALLAFGWGKGVDFWLPDESDVMKSSYLYGYEQSNGILLKAIQYKNGFSNAENECDKKLAKAEQDYWIQKGARMAMEKFTKDLIKQGMS